MYDLVTALDFGFCFGFVFEWISEPVSALTTISAIHFGYFCLFLNKYLYKHPASELDHYTLSVSQSDASFDKCIKIVCACKMS